MNSLKVLSSRIPANVFPALSCLSNGSGSARNYAFKSDLKIKWVRPEKVPCYKPEKSGDLELHPKIDNSQYVWKFRNSKELEDADETVKKLLTLEYAPKKESFLVYRKEMEEKVKRHNYDAGSMEVRLARMTGAIRAWQEIMERFPRHKGLKIRLKELIDKRKKYLKYLRRWDYKRFEWVLEKLNLEYKSHPEKYIRVERKASLRKLTDTYCDEIRDERLNAYKLQLEAEQPIFLQEKINSLEFIRQEQKDCGVEVTVTQEEIDAVKCKLEELKKERESKEEES